MHMKFSLPELCGMIMAHFAFINKKPLPFSLQPGVLGSLPSNEEWSDKGGDKGHNQGISQKGPSTHHGFEALLLKECIGEELLAILHCEALLCTLVQAAARTER